MYGESSAPSTTRQARNATTGARRSGAALTRGRARAAGAPARARAGARAASAPRARRAPAPPRAPRAARRSRSSTGPAASWPNGSAARAQPDPVADGQEREQPVGGGHQRAGGAPGGGERLVAPRGVEPLRQRRLAAHEQV